MDLQRWASSAECTCSYICCMKNNQIPKIALRWIPPPNAKWPKECPQNTWQRTSHEETLKYSPTVNPGDALLPDMGGSNTNAKIWLYLQCKLVIIKFQGLILLLPKIYSKKVLISEKVCSITVKISNDNWKLWSLHCCS